MAFPIGGIGSGMFCVEGSGAFSKFSLRHRPQFFNEPVIFGAVAVKDPGGGDAKARMLAGPVPTWKLSFPWGEEFHSSGDGGRQKTFGFPRFEKAEFRTRFPFAEVTLEDPNFPLRATLTAWNPFVPNDEDASGLPVAGLEYVFRNTSAKPLEAVFSFHSENVVAAPWPLPGGCVARTAGGFQLKQKPGENAAWHEASFAAWIDGENVSVNPAWFRGGWFDPVTMVWKSVQNAEVVDRPPLPDEAPGKGGSLYLPLSLAPGEERRVVLKLAWFVPRGAESLQDKYRPWYASAFAGVDALKAYWSENYTWLRERSRVFAEALLDSTLPPEVLDAVAANLAILKSPTVLRQHDGRVWAWEGCHDNWGSCPGTCTHVWNYAQAMPHLFPRLERGLRETELFESTDENGHQNFRAELPIGPSGKHEWHAAADGQLGGIIKVYRDWRISGDEAWLRKVWPRVRLSLDFCIRTWDPRREGLPVEPQHNTYDVEFWGENGMIATLYLGALAAAVAMGEALGDDISAYAGLLAKGRGRVGPSLFTGEYFQQNIRWKGLVAKDPAAQHGLDNHYSPEGLALLEREGPKYQYGEGCLSDGVLGAWMGWASGLPPFMDDKEVDAHLDAVFRHNFRRDLWEHANPQRPTYAMGHEAGLLICSWPRGGRLSLPLPYSEEIWTGIEYQVAAHLVSRGRVEQGLEIVRAVRARYDGRVRNPFGEFECGHWYARAMASYSLLQAFTGARYDAVAQVLHIAPRIRGDFRGFLCTATGFGTVGVRDGKAFLEVRSGRIDVGRIDYVAA